MQGGAGGGGGGGRNFGILGKFLPSVLGVQTGMTIFVIRLEFLSLYSEKTKLNISINIIMYMHNFSAYA